MRITLALLLLCSTAFADPFDYTLPVSVPSGWPHLPTHYFGSNTNFFQANTNNPDFRTAVQAVGGGGGGGGITLSDATNAAQTVVGWSNSLYLPLHGTADTATTALGGWPTSWAESAITGLGADLSSKVGTNDSRPVVLSGGLVATNPAVNGSTLSVGAGIVQVVNGSGYQPFWFDGTTANFKGNGSGLTNLNAGSLTGTVGVAQLPTGSVLTNGETAAVTFNGHLGVGVASPDTTLRVGATGALGVWAGWGGGGELPSGLLFSSYSGNMSFFPSGSDGLSGARLIFGYNDGSQNRSAVEVSNTTGFATLLLMRSGGKVRVGGDISSSGTLTTTNGVVLPQRTTAPALAQPGAQLWSDGTNLCVILQDAGGNWTTNKCTLTAWP